MSLVPSSFSASYVNAIRLTTSLSTCSFHVLGLTVTQNWCSHSIGMMSLKLWAKHILPGLCCFYLTSVATVVFHSDEKSNGYLLFIKLCYVAPYLQLFLLNPPLWEAGPSLVRQQPATLYATPFTWRATFASIPDALFQILLVTKCALYLQPWTFLNFIPI